MIHKAKTRSLELQSNTFLKAISIQNWPVGRTGLSVGSANTEKTRSSWLNCALRDDEAVYWVGIGHYEAVAIGN